jgi:hypothetical protein
MPEVNLWARHPDDYYIEPEWCSKRLFQVEPFIGGIWDPSCGSGRIVSAAEEILGRTAFGTDIAERPNVRTSPLDFRDFHGTWANIVTNPPFGLCDPKDKSECFVRHALKVAREKVALLLPITWLNPASRSAWLETTPLYTVYALGPRPSMPPGPVIEAGEHPGGGKKDFAWIIWQQGYTGSPTLKFLRRTPDATTGRSIEPSIVNEA